MPKPSLPHVLNRCSAVTVFVVAAFGLSAAPSAADDGWAVATQTVALRPSQHIRSREEFRAELHAHWPQMGETERLNAIDHLIHTGDAPYATELLATETFSATGAKLRARFLSGLAAKAQGDYATAATTFRALLADRPDLHRVRLTLAETLFQAKEDESAKHHFQMVIGGSASNPDLSKLVSGYLEAIDARRSWQFSAYASIAPSTNFNQGSKADTVDLNGLTFALDEDSKGKSGIGLTGGFQGSYRHAITDRVDVIVAAGVTGKRYRDSLFNTALANVSIGPRYRFDRATLGIFATATHRQYGDEDLSTGFGALINGSMKVTDADIAFGSVGCERRLYNDDWRGQDLSYQDGHSCDAHARLDHHFDTTTYGRVLGGVGSLKTGRSHLDHRSISAGVGLSREFGYGITVYGEAKFSKLNFDGIFPSLTEARDDKRLDASVQFTKRDWEIFGLAPQLQYTFTRNISNVTFYDYDAHGAAVTLTKKF